MYKLASILLVLNCVTAASSNAVKTAVNVNAEITKRFPTVMGILDGNAKGGTVYNTCVAEKTWAITFDDGPAEPTLELLKVLKTRGIKATFFVVGSMVEQNRAILKQAYDDGHEIGIHTWTHADLPTLGNAQVLSETVLTYNIIKEVIGQGPLLMRPPYGSYNNRITEILTKIGFKVVMWNLDTEDAISGAAQVQTTTSKLLQKLSKGISLEHDLTYDSVAQADGVIDQLLNVDGKLVKISDCLQVAPYGNLLGDNSSNSTAPTNTTAEFTKPVTTATATATTTLEAQPTSVGSPEKKNDTSSSSRTTVFYGAAIAAVFLMLSK